MFSLRTLIPVLATAVLLVVPAEATTTYYAGAASGAQEASFNTAVTTLTLMNPSLLFAAGDLATGGLFNASGTGIDFLGFDTNFNGSFGTLDFTVNTGKLTATPGELVKITVPAASILAFGIHIAGTGNWCIDLTATGPCAYNLPNTSPAVKFFGFVSDAPVSSSLYIHFLGGNPAIVLPDFKAFSASTITGSEVPEPNSMLLAGFGLVILGVIRRKIQRAG